AQYENTNTNKFKQLREELPTPNSYRTASGAPGHEYWQQQADYKIHMTLDDENTKMYGEETITYINNSPDALNYLWLQLDQNVRAKDSNSHAISTSEANDRISIGQIKRLNPDFDGGFKITEVSDANGKDLKYTINKTMMRVDLPMELKPGNSFVFNVKWWYNINNTREIGGRSGYEHFEEDGNNVYCIAQFFPRMCAYNDVEGWQNKQFLGRGEFALVFGDYDVKLTVPADHLVASTGDLQNPKEVLTKEQIKRWEKAQKETVQPVIIASKEEADDRMKGKVTETKTWHYKAENVRDFGWATSRRFIWDAMGVPMSDGRTVMAASMYVKEGDCLWSQYSTKAVAHTVKWYSHYTFDYPYPIAWSIDGSMGMEYPMICFNYGRCQDDGTYSKRTKYGHIGVIIHEVGHNWFPMIVNSDERQWTWMDEGLNSYVQYLTEQHWERNYPFRRGPARNITNYMGGDKSRIMPIMTNSESIFQFGNNAYGKPATALNILRETVVGRELFDYAFKEYSNRWKFKNPEPADLFRTIEDATGTDLDWFWRGWFYTTDHADQEVVNVEWYNLSSNNPEVEKAEAKAAQPRPDIGWERNKTEIAQTYDEQDESLKDFYTTYDPLDVTNADKRDYKKYFESLSEDEKEVLASGDHFYEIQFKNNGGLVMPIIIEFTYEDGTTELTRIPAEVWKLYPESITKVFRTDKKVIKFHLDPYQEIADTDTTNNVFPREDAKPNKFELFKRQQRRAQENAMQKAKKDKVIRP
ncbi:MAG: M1 family metallopeptidase, partial [Eudoraea sp.]|nr:M1 family metallopeptidase [Eudoraea sp.]